MLLVSLEMEGLDEKSVFRTASFICINISWEAPISSSKKLLPMECKVSRVMMETMLRCQYRQFCY